MKIIKCIIYALVFLVPLAFLPLSPAYLDLGKPYIMFLLVAIGLLMWVGKMILQDRAIILKKSPLNIPVLLVLGAGVLSTVFSQDHWASVLGSYGRFSNGLLALLSFVGLYFLVLNVVDRKSIDALLTTFLTSLTLLITATYLGLFKVLGIFGNSFEGIAVFIALCIVLICSVPLKKTKAGLWQGVLIFSSLGLLCAINFFGAWIALVAGLFGLLAFLVFSRIRLGEKIVFGAVWIPCILLLVSFIFLFASAAVFGARFGPVELKLPIVQHETLLSQSSSWHIGVGALFGSTKNFFLGSGLGTFGIDFSRYAAEVFRGRVDQVGPDRAGNFFAELLATQGILGLGASIIVALLFLVALAIRIAYGFTVRHAMFFAAMAAFVASNFVYYQNMGLQFLFWILLALGVVSLRGTEEEFRFSLTKTVRIALGARILFVAMTIGFCAFVFFGLRFYAADIVFAKAQTVPIKATEAFSLNPYRAEYAVSASQFYFQNVLSELQKSKSSQDSSIISANATLAIRYGTFAQNLAYDRAAIAGTLAFEYENLSFVGGSQDWAIKLYQHAILLEPTNPVLYNELGKLYSLKSDFSEAEKQFTAALALSPRYEDTWVAQALLFEKEGDADRATKQMQDVVGAYPADPNVLFQLGRMYFNSNKISMAIDEFTQALQLNPTFSNAHFALAAAYEKQGDKKQAISEYKKVLQLNPDNTEVAQKLKSL